MAPLTNTHIWCPRCKRRVLQLGPDGKVKIRTKILVFKSLSSVATVICQHCGADVDVDIRLGQDAATGLTVPRMVVRAKRAG